MHSVVTEVCDHPLFPEKASEVSATGSGSGRYREAESITWNVTSYCRACPHAMTYQVFLVAPSTRSFPGAGGQSAQPASGGFPFGIAGRAITGRYAWAW